MTPEGLREWIEWADSQGSFVYDGYRIYAPFFCMCCGVETKPSQFAWGRTCGMCDSGSCDPYHGERDEVRLFKAYFLVEPNQMSERLFDHWLALDMQRYVREHPYPEWWRNYGASREEKLAAYAWTVGAVPTTEPSMA